jgi:hypothetical protein
MADTYKINGHRAPPGCTTSQNRGFSPYLKITVNGRNTSGYLDKGWMIGFYLLQEKELEHGYPVSSSAANFLLLFLTLRKNGTKYSNL